MIEKLGAGGAPLAAGLLERIGELCAGGDEAAGEEQPVDDALLLAAQDALGAALRSLGPETVLATLPLNLQEGLAGAGEARTWLLPLLRMHVRGARLGYWGKVLLPLARELGSRAAAAARWVEGEGRRLCVKGRASKGREPVHAAKLFPGNRGTCPHRLLRPTDCRGVQAPDSRLALPVRASSSAAAAATLRAAARPRFAAPWRPSCGPRCPRLPAGQRTRQRRLSEAGGGGGS